MAYQNAFNWLAMELNKYGDKIACQTSSNAVAAEILIRLPHVSFLAPYPIDLATVAYSFICGKHQLDRSTDRHFKAVAWIEPSKQDLYYLNGLNQSIGATGRLYLISGGPLARFMADRRTMLNGRTIYLNIKTITTVLQKSGFHIISQESWQDVQSVTWYFAGRLTRWIGRYDWGDRFWAASRRTFRERSWCHHLATLHGLVAELSP